MLPEGAHTLVREKYIRNYLMMQCDEITNDSNSKKTKTKNSTNERLVIIP